MSADDWDDEDIIIELKMIDELGDYQFTEFEMNFVDSILKQENWLSPKQRKVAVGIIDKANG